jgi:zinc protease
MQKAHLIRLRRKNDLKKPIQTKVKKPVLSHIKLWYATFLMMGIVLTSPSLAGLFNPQTFTLPNGLQVIVLPNHRAPIVKQILVYKAGSIDEPRGKSGIAHFLEHLMFKGTKNISGKELEKANERSGADQNAQTGRDYTLYHQEVVKSDLEEVMKIEADRMVNLLLDAKDVETERPVILEERRMRIDNEPKSILMEAVAATFFRHHPYRIPIIGWEHEMEKLDQHDAREFYDRWYAPNNAVLVLAGDITLEEAKTLATKYYGPIPKRELKPRTIVSEPDHRGIIQHIEKHSDRVLEPTTLRMYAAPNQRDNLKASFALQVLQHIISSGANGLLYDALVTKQKIASSVAAAYSDSMSRGLATFYVVAQPSPGKKLADVEAAIMKELKTLQDKGVTAEQVQKAKVRMVADIDYIRDDSFGPADIFANALGSGFEISDIEEWKNRVEAVTPEDVNAAARAVLSQEDYLTAHLLPENKEEKSS